MAKVWPISAQKLLSAFELEEQKIIAEDGELIARIEADIATNFNAVIKRKEAKDRINSLFTERKSCFTVNRRAVYDRVSKLLIGSMI